MLGSRMHDDCWLAAGNFSPDEVSRINRSNCRTSAEVIQLVKRRSNRRPGFTTQFSLQPVGHCNLVLNNRIHHQTDPRDPHGNVQPLRLTGNELFGTARPSMTPPGVESRFHTRTTEATRPAANR